MTSTEAELENFRQQWREEVSAKTKGKAPATSAEVAQPSSSKSHISQTSAPAPSAHARHRSIEEVDEVEPHAYSDLGEKQHGRRLHETISAASASASEEPRSALEHYEKAVEKETQEIGRASVGKECPV